MFLPDFLLYLHDYAGGHTSCKCTTNIMQKCCVIIVLQLDGTPIVQETESSCGFGITVIKTWHNKGGSSTNVLLIFKKKVEISSGVPTPVLPNDNFVPPL